MNTMNTMKKKALIIYHGPHCDDGFTSAWIAAKYMEEGGGHFEPDLYPMGYGEEASTELLDFLRGQEPIYDEVYILDFSLQLDVLEVLCKTVRGAPITILDHHLSAFNMYLPNYERTPDEYRNFMLFDGQVNILLNNAKSGAGITWEYFYPYSDVPNIVVYVQDRDLWKFELPYTRQIHKYLADQPKTLADWDAVHTKLELINGKQEVVEEGQHLLDIYNAEVADIAADAEECSIKGERGLMVECEGQYASDVGNILAQRSGTYGMTYYETSDEDMLKCSLRSKGDYDVEAIAKKFGGGGHKNAAGFVLSLEEVMQAVKLNLNEGNGE